MGSGSYRQKAEKKGAGRVDLTTGYRNSQEFCKPVDKHGHPSKIKLCERTIRYILKTKLINTQAHHFVIILLHFLLSTFSRSNMSVGRNTTHGVLLSFSFQLPSDGITVGSLKSAGVEVFTPWGVQTPRISPVQPATKCLWAHSCWGAGRDTVSSVLEKGNSGVS